MKYRITHRTRYHYSRDVVLCHSQARLLPRETHWQHCRSSQLTIQPPPALSSERLDFFGNRVRYFVIQQIHQELEVTAITEVQVRDARPLALADQSPPWEEAVRLLRTRSGPEALEARQFVLDSPFVTAGARFREYAALSFPPGRPLLEALTDLNQRIHDEFTYDPHFSAIATPLDRVLSERRGVCQDFAHLAITCLRSLGLPARYVSGYLETLPPPGQPRLVGADASHAWLAAYIPGDGWAELDPTNACMPGERHITLAWGRDYGDVAPLTGVMTGGGSHTLDVSVDVAPQPESESESGTKPTLKAV